MKPSVFFILVLMFGASAGGETPVFFADANLKAAVEAKLGVTNPTPTKMLDLTTLTAKHLNITSLTGLEHAANLTRLDLYDNQISQLGPLANLTTLTFLDLDDNQISDLNPLSELTRLRHLDLDDNRITDISALSGLSGLRTLYLEDNHIRDISSLSNLNLYTLILDDNQITDVSPIAQMVNLSRFYCESNGLRDIEALSTLSKLQYLDLHDNRISDISALSGLVQLRFLHLHRNRIACLEPLLELTHLNQLDVSSNPLNKSAYSRHLPRIIENNPGLNPVYDQSPYTSLSVDPCEPVLMISSTAGGRITLPFEHTVYACPGEAIAVQAEVASALFQFSGWTGTAVEEGKVAEPNQSSTVVTVDGVYTLAARFESVLDTLIVDSSVDPKGDGTPARPLSSIQDAIDVAGTGARIVIRPGTYHETLTLNDRSVTLSGQWLVDPNVEDALGSEDAKGVHDLALSVVDGNGLGPVLTMVGGEDSYYVIEGLSFTGGRAQTHAAIHCDQSHLIMSHCLISGNQVTGSSGDILRFDNSEVILEHCVITGNRTKSDGLLIGQDSGTVAIDHSIIWNNSGRVADRLNNDMPEIQYSVVEGDWPGYAIFNVDPLFAEDGLWRDNGTPNNRSDDFWLQGDYHLQSRMGRYDHINAWETDEMTSPCIDAGDPSMPWLWEPAPHGSRVNIGLYGATVQASLSSESW